MKTQGRKVERFQSNPVDNVLIDINEVVNPYYKKMDFSPNTLTTLSLVFTLLSSYYFYQSYRYYASFFYMVGYYFDCADGNYARTYKMVTRFGDFYDHFTDMIKMAVFLVLLYLEHDNKSTFILFTAELTVLTFFTMVHLACQEKIYGKESESDFLALLKRFSLDESKIIYTRYFGTGTVQLFIAISLIFF